MGTATDHGHEIRQKCNQKCIDVLHKRIKKEKNAAAQNENKNKKDNADTSKGGENLKEHHYSLI